MLEHRYKPKPIHFLPAALILAVGAASVLGLISPGLSLALQAIIIAFILGQTSAIFGETERQRRHAATAVETFIAEAQRAIDDGDVPEEAMPHLERDLAKAAETLHLIDRCAPWHVRLRAKRARAKT